MDDQVLAFQRGVDDGFFKGVDNAPDDEAMRAAYNAGYEHGVWMYTTVLDEGE